MSAPIAPVFVAQKKGLCGPRVGERREAEPEPAPLPGKANMLLFILHRTKQTSEQAEHKKWMRMESKSTRRKQRIRAALLKGGKGSVKV